MFTVSPPPLGFSLYSICKQWSENARKTRIQKKFKPNHSQQTNNTHPCRSAAFLRHYCVFRHYLFGAIYRISVIQRPRSRHAMYIHRWTISHSFVQFNSILFNQRRTLCHEGKPFILNRSIFGGWYEYNSRKLNRAVALHHRHCFCRQHDVIFFADAPSHIPWFFALRSSSQ